MSSSTAMAMDLDELISKFILTYNNTPCTVTSKTPNEFILSYNPRTLLSRLNPQRDVKQAKNCNRESGTINPKRKDKIVMLKKGNKPDKDTFEANDKVMYKNVFKDFVKWIPARIVKKVSFCTFLVNVNDNIKFVHKSQIRKSSLADKFHPNYLTRNVNEESAAKGIDKKSCSDLKRHSSKGLGLRRSTRKRKAPLRFDFRNYLKY